MRLIAIVIGILGIALPSHAQVPPTKAAEQTFARGRELMKEKKFAAACEAFEQSQRLDPQYGTQYNLAGCYVELGRLASAWNLYRELSRSDTNPDRKQASTDAAAGLATRVPKLSIKLATKPEGTKVSLDGVDALALIGVEAPVDLGEHALVASAPGYKTVNKRVTVSVEGKTLEVALDLEAGSDGDAIAPPQTPTSRKKQLGKIATFAGAGIAITGLIFGGVTLSKKHAADDAYADTMLSADERTRKANDLADTAKLYGNLSTGFVVVGAAATALGVYLWATAPEVSVDRDRVSIAFAGRF